MAFSYAEYKKKKQDQNQNTDDASGKDSTFAGSSERERGTGSFSYSTYREEQKKKKAGSSVQDWLNSSNEFLNEVNQFYSGWQNNTTRNSIYQNRAENLISIADKWREQYANNAEAISQIDSVVSVLSDAKKYVQERHNNYSQWASADDYDAWKSKETFISQYLEDPEKATSTLDYQDDWLKEGQYRMEKNKILGAEDFQDYSQYASTKADNWWDKIWSQYSMGYDDLTYEYINNQDDIRSEISSKSRSFRSDTKDSESVFSENHYDYMTDDEVSIYNYYYAKEGKEKAEEYLNYLGSILEARANNETVENTTKFASEHPIASSVLSVGTSIGSGFEYIEDVLDYGVDKITGKDARLGTNELSLMTNTVRGTVSDMVEWEIGGWDAGAFLYNTAMSGADSLAAGTVFGKFGGAVLGLSAAAQGTNDALERGMSDGQAFWNGLFSGVFEGLFESISIGNFNKLKEVAPESIKDIFKNLGKSMLVNASEETLTEIANIGYDTLINGEFANYTWEELKNGAWKDALFQVLEAGASGALMGVGMSGAGNAIGYHNSSSAAKQTYGSDPGALVGEALEIDPNNAYAQKMQGRLDSGKSLSGGQLMKLNNQVVEGDMQSIQSAAAQRLTELGETGDVEATAAALAKRFSGQELTRKESQLIQNSQYGRRVSTEMNPQNIQSGGFTSGWAEQIGTKRINADEYSRIVEAAQLPQEAAETIGEEVAAEAQNETQAVQAEPMTAAQQEATSSQENQSSGEIVWNLQFGPEATTSEQAGPSAANDQQMTGKLTGKESLQVAEDGVTRQASTGKEVKPKKIASIEGGKVMVETDSGTIAADDIEFDTKENDLLWRGAVEFQGINTAGANGVIHAYRSGQPVATYLSGAAQEFRNGYYNMESGGEYADKLTPWQREVIYELGQKAAGENIAKAQAKAAEAKKVAVSKTENTTTVSKAERVGKVHFDRNGRTFDQMRETSLKTMEQLSKALGVEFYVYESYRNEAGELVYKDANGNEVHAPNGFYDPEDGSIHIDLNAGADGKGTMLFTIAHELTHFIRQWSDAKFKVLANFLVTQYGEKGVSVEKLVDAQIAKANKNGRNLSWDAAYEEFVADSMEAMLTSGNVVQMMAELKQQDQTLWQKICDWFKDLVADLKAVVNAYMGVKPDSKEGKMVAQMEDVIVILESLYADALVDASENYQAGKVQKNTTRESGAEMYSFRGENENGIEVYETSEEIKKLPYKERQQRFLEIMTNEFRGRTAKFIRNGHAYYATFDEKDVNKNIYGDKRSDPKGWKAKINVGAEGNIFELVENTQYNGSLPEQGKKISAHRGVGYWDYFIKNVQIDNTVYDLVANVRKKADGAYVYSIQLNQNKNIEASPPRGSLLRALSGGPYASKQNVAQNADDVKEKFSLRDTVEETENLVAVHNLSEEKLIKSLQLGGLPMPSIAIIRAQDGHSTFGTISLVFGKDTIDPQAYRTNRLYSGDAWTPTYPSVDYKVNDKVRKSISDKIGKLLPEEIRDGLGRVHLDASNMEDTLNRYGGNMVDAFKNDDGMKYAYLKDTGADITLPMKEKDLAYYGSISNAAIRYFSGKLVNGLQTVEMYQNKHSKELLGDKALTEAVADALNWDVLRTMEPGSKEYLEYEQNPLFHADDVSFSNINSLLSATRKLFTGGVQQTVDTQAARMLIKDSVDQSAYEAWLKELFSGIVEKEGIRNDKDYFTPSGNRRSFEALHYEHNLENVIKAMREKGEKGIDVFGGGSIFGAATTEFSSIEEMKQSGDRLQKIPEEEYQKMRDAFSKRFFELASSLPKNKNSFSATDDAANMLVEAVVRYTTKSGMANYLRRESEGWATYNDYVVDDLIELVRDIRNMPTGYFEAKPRRAVGFDEVATAIVPDSVSDELKVKLEDMRIPFVEYATGDEEARKTALNSIEGVKFSDRDSDGNTLSQEQLEYFKDSKVRDAQGRLLVMYHGTPNGGFTKFRSGTYFTQDSGYADVYQNPGASSISSKRGADAPMTYKVYLDIKKPFDTRNAKERRIFQQEFYRKYGTGTPLADSGLPDWVDGMDLQEFIEEMEYDYDGLILDEGGVGGYGDEVVSRGLSYVVFSPEQVKNVDNKTPTSDPDIRYSERDPELEKVNRVLAKENTELKHDVAYLKELLKLQNQVTGGTKFTKTSVEAAAGQLMKYADAKGNKAELAGLLSGLYEYIAGSKELTWDGVAEAAQPAVAWLQSHVRNRTERSAYAQDVLKQIQGSRIYLDEQQKKEVAYQYGSYNEFRKKTMGSVILTDTAATSLDSQWHEWASQYPNLFDADITSTDMPATLMEVFDSLRNMTEGVSYGYDQELFGQELLSRVYDSYWNVSTLYTVKDKAQKEINKLKFDHAGRMATLKKYHKNQTEQLKQEHRAALQKVKQAQQERLDRKLQELSDRYQESRKKNAENRRKTEMRRKIRGTVRDQNKLLNRGDKKRNVKEDMKGFVSKALELADYLLTDHISNDDLVRRGIDNDLMRDNEAKLVDETKEILTQLYDNADSLTDEEFTRLDAKRKRNMEKMKELLTNQRNRMLNTPVYNLFSDLVTEYAGFQNSMQDSVKAAYDPKVEEFLRSYIGEVNGGTDPDRKAALQNMRVADMTEEELWKLHNAYTMVLHSVRTANKLFVKGKSESIEQTVTQIVTEFGSRKIPDNKLGIAMQKFGNKIGWDYEKLYYALERIGSGGFTELIMNLANSENIVMEDVMEAAAVRDEIVEKYGFNNWDVNKKIDKEFIDNTGKKFQLTLGQLMSLYAYSRREGAWYHIEYGGFIFGKAALTNPKPADTYKLSKEQCEAITDTLTKEQKGYVVEMQKFLSEVMGAKGNEVSMLLYGIEMFHGKNFFPIHIAGIFKTQAQEAKAKEEAGFGSLTNAGFTHAQNPNAKAPFILEDFNEVWSDHVNEMSRYHGTVPALEDIRRVMNRSAYSESTAESTSVKQIMQNHFGEEAVKYFDNLYKEANSGAITDKMQGVSKKLLSMFRKNSVAYSLSVLIQQPASLVRAYAMIDKKYFGFKGFGTITSGVFKAATDKLTKKHTDAYNEMLKYAPGVTLAKEIGGFDTASGSSIRSYLLDTKKGFIQKMKTEPIIGKGKAVLDLADDNAIANLPNVADKIAWIEIWNACKRETLAKNTKLSPKSEEFMQTAGQRFTEVIRATQVYDSIFAKSPMLKSKNLAVQYLVSFMNEPNTAANMVESGVRALARGDVKQAARTVTAVVHSIVFTGVLKAIIYAMRDDDEDETFTEKYLAALTDSLIGDVTVFNYLPIARDIWSLVQGYDVERADMAIIADAVDALGKVVKNATTETGDMTEEELAEFDKKVTEANWKLAESVAAFFGIPVKNIRREIEAVIDHARIAHQNAGKTSWLSIEDAIEEAIADASPTFAKPGTKAAADKLYHAIISGDDTYAERLSSAYKTQSSLDSAIRKGLRENDPRITEAAEARFSGDFTKYKEVFLEIRDEGYFDFDTIMAAINAEANDLEKKANGDTTKETTQDDDYDAMFDVENYYTAVVNNDQASASLIYDDLVVEKVAEGYLKHEAKDSIATSFTTQVKNDYLDGEISRTRAVELLTANTGNDETKVKEWDFQLEYGFSWSERVHKYRLGQLSKEDLISAVMDIEGESREGAEAYIDFLDLEMANEEINITANDAASYFEYAEPAGIDIEVYLDYKDQASKCKSDLDENGNTISGSKKAKILNVIDSLELTVAQKDALYYANGWAESTIDDAPWH